MNTDYGAMTRDELKRIKATLSAEFQANTKALTIRKLALQKLGEHTKRENATDANLLALYAENDELMAALKELKVAQKKLPAPANTQKKPRGERPEGKVYFGGEWREGLNAFQKRLVILMAREIGQERYQELKRQALDDYRKRETEFYTGSKHWNGGETVTYEKVLEVVKGGTKTT